MKTPPYLLSAIILMSASFTIADTIVIAPGNGVETNVLDRIDGANDVQINEGTEGGGIVRLENGWNMYSGDTRVACGTLDAALVREIHQPSTLGRNANSAQTLYVGNGTFRYQGPAATSARRLAVDVYGQRHAAVLDIHSDITFTGGAWSKSGTLLKTGSGTLTLEQPDGIYRLTTRGDGFPYPPSPTEFHENGDSPASIYETGSLTVLEGRLAIRGSSAVTNYFGIGDGAGTDPNLGVTYIGKTLADGSERSAHIDIHGGYNHFGEYIRFDASNGFYSAVNSSLNVYGGTAAATYIQLGDAYGKTVATCPEINVYEGGTLKAKYLHLARTLGSKCRLSVYGGTVDASSGAIYLSDGNGALSYGDALLPTAYVTVASNGTLIGNLHIGKNGYSRLVMTLASGGTYRLWGGINTQTAQVTVKGDGGTLRSTSEAEFKNTDFLIGAGGLVLSADQALTFPGKFEDDPAASEIGPLVIECAAANLKGAVNFTGEIHVEGSRSLNLSGPTLASKIKMGSGTLSADADATINWLAHGIGSVPTFAFTAGADGLVKKLILKRWEVPSSVYVKLQNVQLGDTYDLMEVPLECGVSASTFVASAVNDSLSATFSVVTGEGKAIVRATVGPAPAALVDGGSRTWKNVSGGDWAVGDNWAEGSAPADGARTAVSFPAASSGEKTSVSLNKGVALSGLAFDSAPGYKLAGGGSMDVYKSGTAVVSSKSGTNAVDAAMTYSGSIRLAAQLGGRLEIASLEGRGNVQLNDGGSGAAAGLSGLGGVKIGNAQIYGTLRECNGLMEVGSLGPGVTELLIGYGLFRYTGGDYTLNGPLTAQANNWAQTQIEITDPEAVFTVNGRVTQVEGGFTKRGKGALVFNGDGDNFVSHASLHNYGLSDAGYAGHDNKWGSNGLSPIDGSGQAQSFFGLTCAGGALIWGRDGQTLTVRGKDFVVGTTTTASPGCEYDAEAVINGGKTVVAGGNIVLSYNHGNSKKNTAEKETLTARLTVNGGDVSASGDLIIANNDWGLSRTDSKVVLNDGSMSVANVCVGHRDGGASTASVTVNGGSLNASKWFKLAPEQGGNYGKISSASADILGGSVDVGGYFTLGYNSWQNPTTALTVSNAVVRCKESVRAYCGKATVNLYEGAFIRAQGVDVMGTYAGNDHTLNFNGGRFICTKSGNFELKDWKNLNIGEKGAWLDTSEMTGGMLYFRNAVKSAEGSIHVCGDDPMRPVAFDNVAVSAPMTVEPGGSAYSYLTACQESPVIVCGGGAVGSRWTSTAGAVTQFASLTLGTNENDRTTLYFTTGSGFITPVKVDALTVNGIVEISVVNSTHTSLEPVAFSSKPVLIAPKGTISMDRFEYTTLMPMVNATFEVEPYDDNYDKLVMTTTVDQGGGAIGSVHVWTASTGGMWAHGVNWNSPPNNRPDSKIVFPAIDGSAAIDLSGAKTAGEIESSARDLTLQNGTLNISSTSGGKIATKAGTLTLPPVSVDAEGLTLATAAGSTQVVAHAVSTMDPATPVTVNPTAGSGTVRILAPQKGQSFAAASGTIEGPASAFDGGKIAVKNATLRLTEGGFVKSRIEGADEGFVLRTEDDVWFESDVSAPRTFIKAGPGAAYFGGGGAVTLGSRNWDEASDNTTGLNSNGDLPGTKDEDTLFVNAGSLILGLNPSQNINVSSGHLFVGSRFVEFDAAGEIVQPVLEIHGGTVKLPNLRMGNGLGDYRKIPGNESKVIRPTMNVYGGEVSFAGFYMGSSDGNVNSVNTLNLYGGAMRSSDQWIAFGYNRTAYEPQYGQAKSIINIHGGLLELTNPADNVGEISKMNGDVDINLYGGELAYAGRCHVTGNKKSTKINIRLAGGKLTAKKLTCADFDKWDTTGSGGCRALYWNGGVFKPTESGNELAANWTANTVGTYGAKFDLTAIPDGVYTLNKPFTHDENCEGVDGGVALLGGGTLVLNAVNDINGPFTVAGGRMVMNALNPNFGGLVLQGGEFDARGYAVTVPYLHGSGGVATNGTITVSGSIAPLGNDVLYAPYMTVSNLELGSGVVVSSPARQVEENGENIWKIPYFRITGPVAGDRMVFDFGIDGGVELPTGVRMKIAETAVGVRLPPLKVQNYGVERGRAFVKEYVHDESAGLVDVYVVLKPCGTVITVR